MGTMQYYLKGSALALPTPPNLSAPRVSAVEAPAAPKGVWARLTPGGVIKNLFKEYLDLDSLWYPALPVTIPSQLSTRLKVYSQKRLSETALNKGILDTAEGIRDK